MKLIAGSIVVLSGAIAFCSGMAVEAFNRSDFAPWAMLGGVILTIFGLSFIAAGTADVEK